jgi:hypothetical protein
MSLSSPAAVLVTKWAGKMGTDDPPGTQAFNFLLFVSLNMPRADKKSTPFFREFRR